MQYPGSRMARSRTGDGAWVGLAAQLAGGVILLSLVSPQARQTISAAGGMAICLLGLAVVGLIGFGLYRWLTRSQPRSPTLPVERHWRRL